MTAKNAFKLLKTTMKIQLFIHLVLAMIATKHSANNSLKLLMVYASFLEIQRSLSLEAKLSRLYQKPFCQV
jgi:hypothetical protein